MEINLDEILLIMDKGIVNEFQEEVQRDKELEKTEPEQRLSSRKLRRQSKEEEPYLLAWYLDKEIKANQEWSTFVPKMWEEGIKINSQPSSQ
ncbi:hypothetical protein O181_065986 [Austropuccinia psidii MF-1]|uniref:Uncharacterized protein n=1 Tax=Austropuccinia psidii MF-1 TaxID=1389203 RepID=A0A9Q3I1R4_9BASI|nr:hypothetical protein [Austropuccinia psidii MF-1]